MHPSHFAQILLIDKEKDNDKEQDKISTQNHHYAECVEVQGNIRNQLVHIFNISVTEIRNILL